MKLKFIKSFIAVAAVAVAAGCFSSCKDTNEDMVLQVQENLSKKLEVDVARLEGEIANVKALIAAINSCNCDPSQYATKAELNALSTLLSGQIAKIEGDLATLDQNTAAHFATIEGDIASLQSALQLVDSRLAGLDTDVAGLQADVAGLQTDLAQIQGNLSTLEATVTQVQADAAAALNQATANAAVITTLQQDVANQTTEINNLAADLADAKQEAAANLAAAEAALQGQIDNLDTSVSDLINNTLPTLNQDLSDLEQKVAANTRRLDTLDQQVANLTGRVVALENRISGLLINQISNPIIGCLSTPVGINTMILFNYWGNTNHAVKFPDFTGNTDTNYGNTYNNINEGNLQPAFLTLAAGDQFNISDFGTLYFTVNPTKIDMTGKSFELVNSLGEVSAIELSNVAPSNKKLEFGYMRAPAQGTSANGFYQANATLAVEDAPAVQIHVEDGMKAAVKEAFKDLKHRQLAGFAELGRLVYDQFNGIVPALALRASWEENGATQTVLSNYDIAGATFRPLSFATAYNSDFSQYLPAIPSFDDLVGDLTFNFETGELDLNFKPITIDTSKINFNVSISTTVNISLEDIPVSVVIDPIEVKDDAGNVVGTTEETTVDTTVDMQDVETAVKTAIEEALNNIKSDLNSQIQAEFDKAIKEIADQISTQIDDMLASLQDQVNDYLGDVMGSLQNQVNDKIESVLDKIDRYYSRIENLYSRLNKVLSNPNHYMQVFMAYKNGNSIHRLSTSRALPTILGGNGTAITLLATTYNAEILSPCYKKYVAVTNVYDANGNNANNNAELEAVLKAANKSAYLNEVVDGERHTFAFNFADGRGKGYTYEIFYQALDFHGMTSTQKFYVKVK